MNADLIGYEWDDGEGNVYVVVGDAPIAGYVEVDWVLPDDSVRATYRVADQVRRRRDLS